MVTLNKNEIVSLLRLLEDPDVKVYELVKDKIMQNGEFFKIYLENYHSFSSNNLGIERSEGLLDEIFFEKFEAKLKKYLSKPDPQLAEGVFLLETYFNRDVDVNQIEANFDTILRNVWIELNPQLTGIEKVKVINRVLFEELKFKKYPVGEFNHEYLSITGNLSYKKYIAPTISLIYCMIAQQTDIPIFPIEIQGIFLLGYVDKELADAVFSEDNNGIVFYFHPYDEGSLINQQVIEKYLNDNKIETKISSIKTQNYLEYLSFIFSLRVLAIKQKKTDDFCLRYAKKVGVLFNGK
jgi:hypothetical protein